MTAGARKVIGKGVDTGHSSQREASGPALPTFSSTIVTVVPASRKALARTSSLRVCFIS